MVLVLYMGDSPTETGPSPNCTHKVGNAQVELNALEPVVLTVSIHENTWNQ